MLKAKAGHSLPTFGQRKPQSFTGDYIDLIGGKSMLHGVQTTIIGTNIVHNNIIGTNIVYKNVIREWGGTVAGHEGQPRQVTGRPNGMG
jgi:hypothetical protein